ncbi:MAG: hypothetical protein FWC91_13855, partial [Defluviitaleaceae bacterium]|nr:hypothetical protein [Defluviitaleaceae bacterium]
MINNIMSVCRAVACIVSVLVISGCSSMTKEEVTVISDIAYDINPHLGYTVFISENGRYVPYLVLTNNYNGNTLLLRKYLLDELMPYYPYETGTWGSASYYGDSPLGHFLNDEFFLKFSGT